jgi:hypothetical protein
VHRLSTFQVTLSTQTLAMCDRNRRNVCLLLQYLLQSCSRGVLRVGCGCVCLFLKQYLLHREVKVVRVGSGIVENMCYERRRAEACVD